MSYQHQIDRAEATLARIAATLERTEGLLAAVLDTLVTRTPAPRPAQRAPELPPVYTQGAHYAAAFPPPLTESAPPLQTDPDYGFDLNALSKLAVARWVTPRKSTPGSRVVEFGPFDGPTMGALPLPTAQTWTPAPGKAGPAWCYPNPALTPGAANPLVTQENIASTLAVSGWTATVRPPVSTTRVIKAHIMERDGLTGDPAQWELDHWFPIECAGAVCDIANFWCMPYAPYPGAREKDHVENWLKGQIVGGAMTIAQAHAIISDDWYACFLSIQKMGMLPMLAAYDPDGSSDPDDNA